MALSRRALAATTGTALAKAIPLLGSENPPVIGIGTNNYNVTDADEVAGAPRGARTATHAGGLPR